MSSANSDFAYKWAKSQNTHRTYISNQPRKISAEQITEEISFWKKKLRTSPVSEQTKITDKLLTLYANQAIMDVESVHVNAEPQASKKIKQLIEKYYLDCFRLMSTVNRQSHGHN